MLAQLSIRDIVLIERLDLAFDAGLSVLTGETGAGKSILLDSLSLALGGRGDGSLVRHGSDKGQVTAVFDVPAGHSARRNTVASPSASFGARAARAGGTSAKPLNGGPPMNLEPVIKTIAPRAR